MRVKKEKILTQSFEICNHDIVICNTHAVKGLLSLRDLEEHAHLVEEVSDVHRRINSFFVLLDRRLTSHWNVADYDVQR